MWDSENSAECFYALDRASDAVAYCGYLEGLEAVVTKLHLAVLNNKRKKTRALSSVIKLRLQTWPEYPYLDVTEEHGDKLVHQLSLSLAMIEQPSSAETRSFAVSRMLSILHNEYDAADQYTEPGNE
jgi:hypothetical protein